MNINNTQPIDEIIMNTTKKTFKKGDVIQRPVKTFATTKEINKATDFAMTKYADAIKRLADR
jgi:hypothetical protein